MNRVDLNDNWLLRSENLHYGPEMLPVVAGYKEGWLNTGLPCDVHMPLISNGIIKEPLEADNCYSCEWIEEKSWWFKKVFFADEKLLSDDVVELTLESLDAEADIFLNGHHLAHHRSAFYPFSMDVKKLLECGENVLIIRLSSGLEYYSEYDIFRIKKCIVTEEEVRRKDRGDKRRVFVRKPQYVYGWDWGPRVATCGIVRCAYIQSYNRLAVRSVHTVTKSALCDAEVEFEVEVENFHPYSTINATITIEMSYNDEKAADHEFKVFLRSGLNYLKMSALIKDVKLWWPNGMGGQTLYTVKVSALSGETVDVFPSFKYGIRTLKLNLDSINQNENNFYFEINGIKTYCKGGNWIPADSIYARVTDEKYDTLLREAKEAGFNMLRVWGGGIYEKDIFYNKCNEYGIMLWHDFMFACAMYPDDLEWFSEEVRKEIDYQTRRLRNHASLVLWCGNNENHWGFDEWWINDAKPDFLGGAKCYNIIAPRIVHQNCGSIPYWNSSPYGGEQPNENNMGDRHHWQDCTMNPEMEKRITPEEYDKVSAKFVSEYGYIGPCCKSSVIKYHGNYQIDMKGKVWEIHTNSFEKETVAAGIAKHYKDPGKLNIDEYLLYAGLCQGLMYGYSLEAIRYKENCWGSLFWMYDDCWGEVGWTIIDYYLKRKPSYYFVKRAFESKKLILREEEGTVGVMGINDTSCSTTFVLEYGYISFDGRNKNCSSTVVELKPFSRNIVLEFDKGDHDFMQGIIYAKPGLAVEDIRPAVLRTHVFRELRISKAELKISNLRKNSDSLRFSVESDSFAHAVHFNLGAEICLSDEYFDLLPGECRDITAEGITGEWVLDKIKPVCLYTIGP